MFLKFQDLGGDLQRLIGFHEVRKPNVPGLLQHQN